MKIQVLFQEKTISGRAKIETLTIILNVMILILTLGGLALETHPVGCFAGESPLLLLLLLLLPLLLGWETSLSVCCLTERYFFFAAQLGDMLKFFMLGWKTSLSSFYRMQKNSPQGVRRMSWKIASVAI